MNRVQLARQRLSEIGDPADQLKLIVNAELGEELVTMLPNLVDRDLCRFDLYNEPCSNFSTEGIEPDHANLYIYLVIRLDPEEFTINFAGLMKGFGGDNTAAKLVESIVSKWFGRSHDHGLYGPEMSEANVCALRTYSLDTDLITDVELIAFYHALKGPKAVGVALQMLPERHSTHRVPAEKHLAPVLDHLVSLGIVREVIHEMIIDLLNDKSTLCSLDKIVALAAIADRTKRGSSHYGWGVHPIHKWRDHILEMHFASSAPYSSSSNLTWLASKGVFEDMKRYNNNRHDPMKYCYTLIDALAVGQLAAVFQFVNRFMVRSAGGRSPAKATELARSIVTEMLPEAFETAMHCENYGVAAAISQIASRTIPEEQAQKALENAIIFKQPIVVQWDYMLG